LSKSVLPSVVWQDYNNLGTNKKARSHSLFWRNAIALFLNQSEQLPVNIFLQQINDRLCRIEAALRICPSKNEIEDISENALVQLDVQELPEIVHHLSLYVNEQALIICPHLPSVREAINL
jgi:hypothetical protein